MENDLKEIIEILLELTDSKYQEAKKEVLALKSQNVRNLFTEVFKLVDDKRKYYKGGIHD